MRAICESRAALVSASRGATTVTGGNRCILRRNLFAGDVSRWQFLTMRHRPGPRAPAGREDCYHAEPRRQRMPPRERAQAHTSVRSDSAAVPKVACS